MSDIPEPDPEYYRELDEDEWIDPDIIRGIERVTGEIYKDGIWQKNGGEAT